MDRKTKKFLETETRSKARVLDRSYVEVQAPDGEVFTILSRIGIYENEEIRRVFLHTVETIFDKHFSDDKETMASCIWQELMRSVVPFLGMNAGNRQGERVRIGRRIKELRENRGIDAKDLAQLAGIDAANLCRIEQGKYSVGLDILSKIAFVLGAHIDLVPNET